MNKKVKRRKEIERDTYQDTETSVQINKQRQSKCSTMKTKDK